MEKVMNGEQRISDQAIELMIRRGARLVGSAIQALREEIDRSVRMNENGDLHVPNKREIIRRAQFHPWMEHEIRALLMDAWPSVADQVEYEKRREWANRREEKREAQLCQ